MNDALIWLGIAFCVSQSALFSGSNIAVFSLSRLRLEAAAAAGDTTASSALELRRDANFTLVTILMGNVAINVLLTMLADSVLTGVLAFLFSIVVITALGEIGPQAYFSRNALRAVAIFAPVLRFYRILLWPLAKPTALLLDAWVGTETVPWFRERELHNILRYHAVNTGSEVGRVEAIGRSTSSRSTISSCRIKANLSIPTASCNCPSMRIAQSSLQSTARETIPLSVSWPHRGRSGSSCRMRKGSRACC